MSGTNPSIPRPTGPLTSSQGPAPRERPVTIVTGFLGSGKTTLVNRLLQEQHGMKLAVVLNEIGEVNLDSELVMQSLGEDLKIMNNGCVCCTVRDDLSRIARDLVTRGVDFDALVIETTGMADPSPVAQTFFMDESLQEHYFLDAIVTVVDAKHIERNLAELRETQDQIGFADVVLLNKSDLVAPAVLDDVERKVKTMNGMARIFRTERSNVPLGEILGIGAFNLDARRALDPSLLEEYHAHSHDDEIQSIYIEESRPLDIERLNRFMSLIVSELGSQVLRAKGVVNIKGEDNRIVFQGVHMTMGSAPDRPWAPDEPRKTQMVFIGRHLPRDVLEEGVRLCVAKS